MTARFAIDDEASVLFARQQARDLATRLGLPEDVAGAAALVTSELGYNQLKHARLGEVALREVQRGRFTGLEVVASDTGDGLQHPLLAFRGEHRGPATGLGVGLGGVRRMAYELDVHNRTSEGLRIFARFFPDGTPREPEYAITGRPHPDERYSGDDAIVIRRNHRLILGLADGLGHGREAREASHAACRCCEAHAESDPVEVLRACDGALRTTRGTALAVACIDLLTDTVTVAIAGNVRAGLFDTEGGRRFTYTPHVLGGGRQHRLRQETAPRDGRTFVMFTDGLPDRVDPSTDRPGVSGWPLPLAARLLERHARNSDDATVVVVR